MIRVFLAPTPDAFRRAREGTPCVVGSDAREVRARLQEAGRLSWAEATAVERALGEIQHGASVDVVVGAGGALFRIFRTEAPPEVLSVEPPAIDEQDWSTREKGARVLVAGGDASSSRLVDVLRFLGYEARSLFLVDQDPTAVGRSLAELAPAVVVFDELSAPSPEVVAACREHRCAIVLVGRDETDAPEADGYLPLPLLSERIASQLDPVIARRRPG